MEDEWGKIQTQFPPFCFLEETLSIQEKVKETQPMELGRLSSMKSYQQWLVDCDCLLERVDPTVRP